MAATPLRTREDRVDSAPSSPSLSTNDSLTSTVKQRHNLLQRPLYAFQLPPSLLASLKLRSIDVQSPTLASPPANTSAGPSATASAQAATTSTSLTCKLCPSHPTFPTSGHQRAHFRSEWHRYNLQVALKTGATPANPLGLVDEKGWEDLANDLGDVTEEESISGTTDDEQGASKSSKASDLVSLVIKKLNLNGETNKKVSFNTRSKDEVTTDEEVEDDDLLISPHVRGGVIRAKSALLWFATQPSQGADGRVHLEQTQFGLYRSIFPEVTSMPVTPTSAPDWHVGALQASQATPLRRAPTKGGKTSGWKGKRLKGMEDAAGMLGVNFLEGEGYIAGLVTAKTERRYDSREASEEDSDGLVSSSSSEEEMETASATTASSVSRTIDPPLRTWTILLFGGGHFSIAVVALNPHIKPRVASRNRPLPLQGSDEEILSEDRSLIVLAHKAFHRYTTRRKQGGSQSAQDASGKFAKSAGAQLRRAGEVALAEEVRALLNLSGWRKLIGETERVYARAGGRAARGILWTWPGDVSSPLEGPKSDGRLRNVPFSTRSKATVGECLRVFAELSKVKIGRKTEQELEEEDEAYRCSLAGNEAAREELQKRRERERLEREEGLRRLREKAKRRRGQEGLLSKEEKKRRERFERMIEMVQRGRVEALINHLGKYGPQLLPVAGWEAGNESKEDSIDSCLPQWWRERQLPPASSTRRAGSVLIPSTLLQVASEAGQEEVIQWLLVEKRADPTIGVAPPPPYPSSSGNPVSHTPSDLAQESSTWPHRTAYDLVPASSKGSRNVFRRLKANQPDWFDWEGKGRVLDLALTEEMEEKQSKRKAGFREKARAREREREEREKEQKATQDASQGDSPTQRDPAIPTTTQPSSSTRNRLGGGSANQSVTAARALKDARDKLEGVSPEMRARIEREKRARAAEERMRKLQQGAGGGGQG